MLVAKQTMFTPTRIV